MGTFNQTQRSDILSTGRRQHLSPSRWVTSSANLARNADGSLPLRSRQVPKTGERRKGTRTLSKRRQRKTMSEPAPAISRLRFCSVRDRNEGVSRFSLSSVVFAPCPLPFAVSPVRLDATMCDSFVLSQWIVVYLGGGWGDENFQQQKTFLVGGSLCCGCGVRCVGLGLCFTTVLRYRRPRSRPPAVR